MILDDSFSADILIAVMFCSISGSSASEQSGPTSREPGQHRRQILQSQTRECRPQSKVWQRYLFGLSWTASCFEKSLSGPIFKSLSIDFFTQSELIEPVSPKAAQLGIHFFLSQHS